MDLIQKELDEAKHIWNIRAQNRSVVNGIPNHVSEIRGKKSSTWNTI